MPLPIAAIGLGGIVTGLGFHASSELFDWFNGAPEKTEAEKPAIVIGAPATEIKDMAGSGGIAISRGAALTGGAVALIIAWWAFK